MIPTPISGVTGLPQFLHFLFIASSCDMIYLLIFKLHLEHDFMRLFQACQTIYAVVKVKVVVLTINFVAFTLKNRVSAKMAMGYNAHGSPPR